MRVSRAVITAASRKQRGLALQSLIDSDGVEKTVLAIIIEETLRAGIEDICLVVCPGDEEAYEEAAGTHAGRLTFVQQVEPRGYGHAIYCAHKFTGAAPFLHLVGDHLYVGESGKGCAQRLVEVAEAQECAVSAVQPSHESLLPYYGCVGGKRVRGSEGLYQVETIREKPTPTEAEQFLNVPGLRAGYYLCFFGMHVLTPAVMALLERRIAEAGDFDQVDLSGSLGELAGRERYLALESSGHRYDVGVPYGMLMAQLALALSGSDRDLVLAKLVELLARRELGRSAR